jgi:hypothetical protein
MGGSKILLFLKKKKQKDFFKRCAAGASLPTGSPASDGKKSFGSFLQKRTASFLTSLPPNIQSPPP